MMGINTTKHKRNSNYNGLGGHHHNVSISSETGPSLHIKNAINQNNASPARAGRPGQALGRGPPLPVSTQNGQNTASSGLNSISGKGRFRQQSNQ
jgi:hypothetical protein